MLCLTNLNLQHPSPVGRDHGAMVIVHVAFFLSD